MSESFYPVVSWRGRMPVISSAYRTSDRPDHHGVDIMFRREASDAVAFPVGSPGGSKRFVMPEGVDVVAWRGGKLWSAGLDPDTGYFAVVDHGKPYASLYLHMATLAVPRTKASQLDKPRIRAGQALGTVGYSPSDGAKLRHLHFEVWFGGDADDHIDPAPLLAGARVLPSARWERLAALLAGLVGLAWWTRKSGGNVPTR